MKFKTMERIYFAVDGTSSFSIFRNGRNKGNCENYKVGLAQAIQLTAVLQIIRTRYKIWEN